MTIALSTHRRDSLVRRRSAERAGAGMDRRAHRRPGAGFLPLRLPVARRARAGYRIYSADDFFLGLDREAFEPYAADRRTRARRKERVGSTDVGRRLVSWAVLSGTVAAAIAIFWHAIALRATRPGARASLRGIHSSASPKGADLSTARSVAAARIGAGSRALSRRSGAARVRPRRNARGRGPLLRSAAGDERPRVVPLPLTRTQPPAASAERLSPRASSAATPEGHVEFGFER
jgi:hypothetical protein